MFFLVKTSRITAKLSEEKGRVKSLEMRLKKTLAENKKLLKLNEGLRRSEERLRGTSRKLSESSEAKVESFSSRARAMSLPSLKDAPISASFLSWEDESERNKRRQEPLQFSNDLERQIGLADFTSPLSPLKQQSTPKNMQTGFRQNDLIDDLSSLLDFTSLEAGQKSSSASLLSEDKKFEDLQEPKDLTDLADKGEGVK